MDAVNQQPWDNSVKGLTQFPDVLNQMSSNLSGHRHWVTPTSMLRKV
jgi:hypothetical protein